MTDLETKIIQELRSGRRSATDLRSRLEVPLPDLMTALSALENANVVRWRIAPPENPNDVMIMRGPSDPSCEWELRAA